MTLTEFLLARIAEDEGLARSCEVIHWRSWVEGRDGRGADSALFMNVHKADGSAFVDVYGWPTDETQDHAARHDPARVLAECKAKREIVHLHDAVQYGDFDADAWTAMKDALRSLAAVYADHPDYQQEWKQ